MTQWLRRVWCEWFHDDAQLCRSDRGIFFWQCRKCNRRF